MQGYNKQHAFTSLGNKPIWSLRSGLTDFHEAEAVVGIIHAYERL
jgi:hypothetical protein